MIEKNSMLWMIKKILKVKNSKRPSSEKWLIVHLLSLRKSKNHS